MSTFNELIDFTRSTTGTYLDSVVYGDELVTNGDFSSDSDWTKTGNLTAISNGTATIGGTAGNGTIRQEDALIAGKTYIVKFDITAVSSASAILAFRNDEFSSVGSAVISFGSSLSVATYSKVFVATGSIVNFTVGGGNSSLAIDNISVKERIGGQVSGTPLLRTAAINEPRLEYDASGNPLGLLIEEARTNLLQYSEDFAGSYWTKGSITISPNNAIAPDGSASADKIVPNAINDRNHIIYKNITRSTLDAFSLFVKPAGFDYVSLILQASANTDSMGVQFNLLTGTVVTSQNANGIIQDVGNGWYRVTVTPTTSTTFYYAVIQPNDGTAPNTSDFFRSTFTGNGSDGVYLWGAQFEQGAFPTSYIPTEGSSVTRAIDSAVATLSDFYYRQKNGSMVVEFTSKYDESATRFNRVYDIGNANTNVNRIITYIKTDATTLAVNVWDNGSAQVGKTLTTSAPNGTGVYSKVAMAWETNNAHSALDGNLVGSVDTSVSLTQTRDTLGIMRGANNTNDTLTGYIKSIQYYPKRLSNTELQLLTQPSASPTMNLTFDGQATSTLVEGFHD